MEVYLSTFFAFCDRMRKELKNTQYLKNYKNWVVIREFANVTSSNFDDSLLKCTKELFICLHLMNLLVLISF